MSAQDMQHEKRKDAAGAYRGEPPCYLCMGAAMLLRAHYSAPRFPATPTRCCCVVPSYWRRTRQADAFALHQHQHAVLPSNFTMGAALR
jgi:hypothetical protein